MASLRVPASKEIARDVTARRLRKRELDRYAQRKARERTKSRIAYLEGLVEELRKDDSTGRVSSLMRQLDEVTKQRDELVRVMRTIENLVRSKRLADSRTTRTTDNANEPTNPENSSGDREQDPIAIDLTRLTPPPAQPESLPTPESSTTASPDESDLIIPPKSSCHCSIPNTTRPPNKPFNLWRYANEVLSPKVSPAYSTDQLHEEDAFSDDVVIRMLVEGWPAVSARAPLSPLWAKLKQIDDILFHKCRGTERLAIMRLMHMLLKYHIDPSSARESLLPAWYLKRPSQRHIAHSYAIDFFGWPGVRERFVFGQHRYCENVFWHLFAKSFSFLWPCEFRDAYSRNVRTGEYKVSEEFDRRLKDINAWTMGKDFFERFPEFYGDIPAFCEVPRGMEVLLLPAQQQGEGQPTSECTVDESDAEEGSSTANDFLDWFQPEAASPLEKASGLSMLGDMYAEMDLMTEMSLPDISHFMTPLI
jgi:Domain of unknown function (DUF3425)